MHPPILAFCLVVGLAYQAAAGTLPQKPLVEFQYRPVGKLIYVSVSVNGAQSRWFCFDSGARHSIVDTHEAEGLGLGALASESVRGTGRGEVAAIERKTPLTTTWSSDPQW